MSAIAAITTLTQAALREVPLPFACSPAQLRLRDCLNGILQAAESASELYAAARKEADEFGNRLASANEYVIELLFALDDRQKHYEPRPHAEIVELIHDLLSALSGEDDQPTTLGSVEMPSDLAELGVSQ